MKKKVLVAVSAILLIFIIAIIVGFATGFIWIDRGDNPVVDVPTQNEGTEGSDVIVPIPNVPTIEIEEPDDDGVDVSEILDRYNNINFFEESNGSTSGGNDSEEDDFFEGDNIMYSDKVNEGASNFYFTNTDLYSTNSLFGDYNLNFTCEKTGGTLIVKSLNPNADVNDCYESILIRYGFTQYLYSKKESIGMDAEIELGKGVKDREKYFSAYIPPDYRDPTVLDTGEQLLCDYTYETDFGKATLIVIMNYESDFSGVYLVEFNNGTKVELDLYETQTYKYIKYLAEEFCKDNIRLE